MMSSQTCLERAYVLAREGKSLTQIKATLRVEGYANVEVQLHGRALIAALKRARAAALA